MVVAIQCALCRSAGVTTGASLGMALNYSLTELHSTS